MATSTEAALGRWPLVARQIELRTCRSLLYDGNLVLAGQPGVGKTRLCREVAAWALEQGWHVEHVAGTRAGSDVPLAAVAPLLPDIGHVSNEALIRATLHHLRARAAGSRLLIIVDDGHLLDSASCTLVHLLVSSGAATAAITVTSGHPTPDPIVALWKDQLATRIELQALSRRESADLLHTAFGRPLEPTVESRLWELSLGNTMFLRELVISNITAGALDEVDGLIRWVREPVVAPRLSDLVESRLSTLSAAERRAMETLALSEPLELDVLESLSEPGAVEALERQQLVSVTVHQQRRTARLAHPVYGQALQASLPTSTVERTYRQLADALERTDAGRSEDVLRLVTWRLAARDPLDKDLLSAATVRAWQLGEMAECERFARLAVDAGADLFIAVLLAQSQMRQGRAHDTLELLQEKLADTDASGDRELLRCTLGASLGWGCGRLDEAEELLRGDLDGPATHPLRHAMLAVTELMQGDTAASVARAEAVLAESNNLIACSYSNTALATTVFGTGDLVRSQAIVDASDPRSGDAMLLPFAHVRKASNHTCALVAHGRVLDALEFAREPHQQSVDDGDDTSRVRWGFVLGFAHLFAGDLVAAARLLDDAAERSVRCEPVMGDFAAPLAHLARELLGESNPAAPAPWRWAFAAPVHALAAAHLGGQVDVATLADAAGTAHAHGWPFIELFAHLLSLRQGRVISPTAIDAAAERVGGALAPIIVDHARALATDDGGSLAEVAGRYEALGYRWFAADAYARASTTHAAAGRHAAASKAADDSRRLAAATGLRVTALGALDDDPLTAREREVVGLVAQGRSDKQVADALFLSVRTVNAHLRNIYTKLGVNSRSELSSYRPPTW